MRSAPTWDVCAVVLDVHLMQASLGGGVLNRHRPVQVVCNQRLSRFTWRHQHFTCRENQSSASLFIQDLGLSYTPLLYNLQGVYRWFLPSWKRTGWSCQTVWSRCRSRCCWLAGSFLTSPGGHTGGEGLSIKAGNLWTAQQTCCCCSQAPPTLGHYGMRGAEKQRGGRQKVVTMMMQPVTKNGKHESPWMTDDTVCRAAQKPKVYSKMLEVGRNPIGWEAKGSDDVIEGKQPSEWTLKRRERKRGTCSRSPATERSVCVCFNPSFIQVKMFNLNLIFHWKLNTLIIYISLYCILIF